MGFGVLTAISVTVLVSVAGLLTNSSQEFRFQGLICSLVLSSQGSVFLIYLLEKKKAKKCQTLKSTGNRKFDMDGRKKFDVAGS